MRIRACKLRTGAFGDQWREEVEDRWDYEDFLERPDWRKEWISFDGVVYHAGTDRVYCGLTSFDADIFKVYDCRAGRFLDTDFGKVADGYDAKFHRSMELTGDGSALYLGTALLHDVDHYFDAPGGGIFRHNVGSGVTEKLGIPLPHVYIQGLALDEERGVVYAMHFTPERLSLFDVETRQGRDLGPIGSGVAMGQGENVVLDDAGCAWTGWSQTRAWQNAPGVDSHRLCKYDPEQNRIHYFKAGLPRRDGGYGFAKVEGLFNLGTRCLYASGDNGSLYRVETKTAEAKYLGTPIADHSSRLTSLARHSDGYAYGVTGREGRCRLLRFDPRGEQYELGDPIVDEEGVAMWQCHDVDITPEGVLYAGENDHPRRSGYLWEIRI